MNNKKKFKFVGRMFLGSATLISIVFFNSCKKDNREQDSKKSSQLSTAYAVSEDDVSNLLDDWWANYALYKNIDYTNDVVPNLNASVPQEYADNMLHYSLNVALVKPDSTYEDVTTDSVFYTYTPANGNTSLTKRDVCTAFDNIKDQIKAKLQSSDLVEQTINSISVYDNSTSGNSFGLKVVFSATGGNLIGTSDPNSGVNVSTSYFPNNTSIPWVSQQSASKPYSSPSIYDKYWTWLMDGNDYSQNPTNGPQCLTSYNKLPTTKPAHQYLSSAQFFWPTTTLFCPSCPVYGPNYVAVASPEVKSGSTITVFDFFDNKSYLAAQEVQDCYNPIAPASISITPTALNAQPSAIHSWYGTEFSFSLTAVRNLSAAPMNYYFSKRPVIAAAGYNKLSSDPQKSTKINTTLSTLHGFFAITELRYDINNWTLPGSANNACYQTPCGSICDHLAEYKVYVKMKHYTMQRTTPKQFILIFA